MSRRLLHTPTAPPNTKRTQHDAKQLWHRRRWDTVVTCMMVLMTSRTFHVCQPRTSSLLVPQAGSLNVW